MTSTTLSPSALVTGVRKGGAAAAVAAALEDEGWTVARAGWRPCDRGTPWESGTPEAIEEDLGDPEAPRRVIAVAEDAVGPLTALVCAHAHSRHGGVLETTAEDFDRHLAVNARATLLLVAEFARRWSGEAGTGRIVTFTSGALGGEVAYAASKAALERLTRAAALELAPSGITVNAVDPGPTDSGWMSQATRERIRERTPARRLGTPEDAARLVAFLCSARAAWITGQVIRSDGGYALGH